MNIRKYTVRKNLKFTDTQQGKAIYKFQNKKEKF